MQEVTEWNTYKYIYICAHIHIDISIEDVQCMSFLDRTCANTGQNMFIRFSFILLCEDVQG